MQFTYVVLEPNGKKRTGYIEAASKEAATQIVTADGKYLLELKEDRSVATAEDKAMRQGRKVTKGDLALFTRRLADLSAAGLPLDRTLQVIAEQSENAALSYVAEQALEDVRAGSPVSDALSKHPKFFPSVYAQTLKAGEASGQFPQVAARLADFQEKEVARRSQIISALIYPAILGSTAVLVIIFLLTFVVPRLSGVFKDLGNDLPITTRILLSTTDFITTNYILILISIVVAVVGYRAWSATEGGALAKDSFLLRAPVFGNVIRKATVSRFARVLSTLVYGGVPILESLQLAGLAAGNRVFMRDAEKVSQDVRDGRAIADSMRDTGAFPPVLTHMVAIGEETGDLPSMLNRVSDSLDFEVDMGLRRAVSFIEPLIMLFMGVFVGFVVLSVVLPILAAQNTVK